MERESSGIVSLMLNMCLWLALVPFFITQANSAQDKSVAREVLADNNPGFISIDCGSNIDYFDNDTGIWYQTDQEFVKTGTNHLVSSTVNLNYVYFARRLNTLRCFPEGERNCYKLEPKQGKNNRYLIRAFFSYGNYDGKNENPVFELHLGVNFWRKVNVSAYFTFDEVILTSSSDTIDVCLVKTGPTIPCISSLELRVLNSSSYQNQIMSVSDPQPLLLYQVRTDVGSPQLQSPDNVE